MLIDLEDLNRLFNKVYFKRQPTAPSAPDPVATANAQAAANKETALTQAALNRIDEFNPLGSRVFSPTGENAFDQTGFNEAQTQFNTDLGAFNQSVAGTEAIPGTGTGGPLISTGFNEVGDEIFGPSGIPGTAAIPPNPNAIRPIAPNREDFFGTNVDPLRFKAVTTLNPTAQAGFEAEQRVQRDTNLLAEGQLGRIGEAVENPFTFEGLPGAPTGSLEGRQRVEDALFNRLTSRLDTRFNTDEDNLRGRLITQGIDPNTTKAGQTALREFGFRKDDAFDSASLDAILAGGQEQTRQFGLQSAERERAIQEQQFLRQLPLNEAVALLRGGGDIGIPQFGAPPQTGVAATDVIGAQALASRIAQQNFQQQSNSVNAFNQGLFSLGGAAIGAGFGGGGFGGGSGQLDLTPQFGF